LASRYNDLHDEEMEKVYGDWAKLGLSWFNQSGMINERGTINDGLTKECMNNNKTVWTYNQGAIIGELVEIHGMYPELAYLDLAVDIAKAVLLEHRDVHVMLHEVCESNCGAGGAQLKSIFVKNLIRLSRTLPTNYKEEDLWEYLADEIRRSADSIWTTDRMGVTI
jgi:predicted alpha-1,6-mannanase (GH76 family)